MTVEFWLSLVLGVAGITGIRLGAKGYWQGWALGLAVQPVWFVYALVTGGYGLLLICFGYGYVYARNLIDLRRKRLDRQGAHD